MKEYSYMKILYSILAILAVSGCTGTNVFPERNLAGDTFCQTPVFRIDNEFPSGNFSSCTVIDSHTVEVLLVPEDIPVNPSPWYAMRLASGSKADVRVVLNYTEHPHRYKPKASYGGASWSLLPEAAVSKQEDGYRVTVALDLDPEKGPLFLAGQELFTNEAYDSWIAELAGKEFVSIEQAGQSAEGRPVMMLSTTADDPQAGTVFLAGRQHPPEITGALAMVRFTEELLGDSALARNFRQRFNLVILPNLNPDGVEHGYWRHNTGGVDLNRDWGPFTQPETRIAKSVIDSIQGRGPVLFLDFHSTGKNIFYTQPEGDDGTDYGFTAIWLKRSQDRLPAFKTGRQGAHNTGRATSKAYMHQRFGIPAITYEIGDQTDRKLIAESSAVYAQEMMRLLLEKE